MFEDALTDPVPPADDPHGRDHDGREFDYRLLVAGLRSRATIGLLSAGRACSTLPAHLRQTRRSDQQRLWDLGHPSIVDEVLLADAIARRPALARRIARKLRRGPNVT